MLENLKNIEFKSGCKSTEELSGQISNFTMNTINSATYCGDCGGIMVRKGARMVCEGCMD